MPEAESRQSVAITVFWMLTAVTSLAAQVVALISWLAIRYTPIDPAEPRAQHLMPEVMLLAATVSGLVCLGLTVLVYRVRPAPPPRGVTIAAVVVSLLPLLTVAVRAAR